MLPYEMNLTPVSSSTIEAIGWSESKNDPKSPFLGVKFLTGDIYVYFNVPKGIYERLMASDSKGKFFYTYVKVAGYQFKKLTPTLTSTQDVKSERERVLDAIKDMVKCGLARIDTDEEGLPRITFTGDKIKEYMKDIK